LKTRVGDFEYPNSRLKRLFSGRIKGTLGEKYTEALRSVGVEYLYQLAATPIVSEECNFYYIEGIPVEEGFVFSHTLEPILDAINAEPISVDFFQYYRQQLLSTDLQEIMAMDTNHPAACRQLDQIPE